MPQTHQSLHSPMSLDLSRRNVLPIYGDRTRTGHANQKSRRATAPRKVIGYVRATLMVSTRHHRLRSAEWSAVTCRTERPRKALSIQPATKLAVLVHLSLASIRDRFRQWCSMALLMTSINLPG